MTTIIGYSARMEDLDTDLPISEYCSKIQIKPQYGCKRIVTPKYDVWDNNSTGGLLDGHPRKVMAFPIYSCLKSSLKQVFMLKSKPIKKSEFKIKWFGHMCYLAIPFGKLSESCVKCIKTIDQYMHDKINGSTGVIKILSYENKKTYDVSNISYLTIDGDDLLIYYQQPEDMPYVFINDSKTSISQLPDQICDHLGDHNIISIACEFALFLNRKPNGTSSINTARLLINCRQMVITHIPDS